MANKKGNNRTKKTAGIYTPYDLVHGGGERYLLTFAEYLASEDYEVFLVLDEIYSRLRLKQMERELGISLDNVRITRYSEAQNMKIFDVFAAMSNSLVPPVSSLGNFNIYICQFPFPQEEEYIYKNSKYLSQYQKVIVYSNFVLANYKKLLKTYGLPDIPAEVVYPPCVSEGDGGIKFINKPNDKILILTVGRFFTEGHCKRQDFLIEAFIKMLSLNPELNNVELHIAGSIHPTKDGRDYFSKLNEMAKEHRHNIFLYGNIDADALKKLYADSHIYWHAAGINVNPAEHPEMLEHFGITVVEAMASECIPVVINKGGPAEIVGNGTDGFCFDAENELIEHTLYLINIISGTNRNSGENRTGEWSNLSNNALNRAAEFTKERFYKRLSTLIN